jgi:hypothetical protein
MDIRIFQLIGALIGIMFIIWILKKIYSNESSFSDSWYNLLVAFVLVLLAVFPDFISGAIAEILDFKNNVNAILFVLLGLVFIGYFMVILKLNKQNKLMTTLAKEMALLQAEQRDKKH